MSLALISRAEIGSGDWDGVVRGSPDGWVFSLFGWQELILAVKPWGLEDFSFGMCENGKLVAVVPLQFNPHNGRMSSSAWGGSGPVLDGLLEGKGRQRLMQEALEHCVALARQRGATQFDLSTSPVTRTSIGNTWGVNPFLLHGLEDRSDLSQVIDLGQSQEELWAGLATDARRQIRIARERGFTVERADWGESVKHYYSLHEDTYRRTGVQPHPIAYFSGIAGYTAGTNNSVLWRARAPAGDVVAYHNAAWFAPGAYYHTGCSTKESGESGVSYLLFWEALRGAKEAGLMWYDCGAVFPNSADTKQRGLSMFKSKFGGQPHRAFVGVKYLGAPEKPRDCSEATPPLRSRVYNLLVRIRYRLQAAIGKGTGLRLAKIRFIRPYWSWKEIVAVLLRTECSETRSDELNSNFRRAISCREDANVFFVSSGRTALEVVFRGLKTMNPARSKVLLPSYGCLGILQPLLNSGLRPSFVDIDDDLLPSTEDILACLDQDTLAILLVHLSGKGEVFEAVRARAKQLGVFVVDDFCHNLGGRPFVSEVDIAVFSFSLGKNVSASAGGAIVDNTGSTQINALMGGLAVERSGNARARFRHFLSLYGPVWWRVFGERLDADSDALSSRYGLYKLSELDACLLHLQLQKLGNIIKNRRHNAGCIGALISKFTRVYGLQDSKNHIYTKMSVVLRTQRMFDAFMSFMNGQGIEIEGMYSPLHLRREAMGICHHGLEKTMAIYPRVVNVPVRPNLARWEVRKIANAMQEFAERVENEQY